MLLILTGIYIFVFIDGGSGGEEGPPSELGGYVLAEYISGEAAIQSLGSIHAFLPSNEYIVDGLVAVYTKDGDVVHIWMAVFISEEVALNLTQRMYLKMSEGGSQYSIPETLDLNGLTVYYGSGRGMYYFFFSYGESVVWISTSDPTSVKNAVIPELLDYI